jgi:hypothetical protein
MITSILYGIIYVLSFYATVTYWHNCFENLSFTSYFISSPVTGLDRPRGFQEVKVPRFHDNGTGWW